MSIVKIREATTKPGCQVALGLIGLLLAVGMAFTYNSFSHNQDQNNPEGRTLFEVGSEKFTASQFEQRVNQVADSRRIVRGEPQAEFQAIGFTLSQIVDEKVYRQIAKDKGVVVADADIRTAVEAEIKASLDQFKEQLKATLPKDASEEAVEQAFTTANGGKSSAQYLSETMLEVENVLKDPQRRASLELSTLNSLLPKSYESSVNYTEEDLKQSYRSYNFDVIAIDPTAKDQTNKEDRIQKAKAELEAGADPKTVRQKYAEGSTQDKTTLTYALINGDENLKQLLDLQPGQVSEVIDANGFPIIYKLVKVDAGLPADFEKNKATLLADAKKQRAAEAFQKDVEAKRDSVDIKWNEEGLHILYDAVRKLTDFTLMFQPDKLQTELQSILKRAEEAKEADPRILALVKYNVADVLYQTAQDPTKKEEFQDIYADALTEVLDFYESTTTRLAAVDLFLKSGQNDRAFEQFLQAAKNNRDFEQTGQGLYAQMGALLETVKKDKNFTPEEIEEIDAELQKYMAEKIAFDEEMAALDDQETSGASDDVNKMLDEENEAGKKEEAAAQFSSSATTGSSAPAESTTGQ